MGDAIAKLARREGLKVTTHRFRKIQATQLMAAGVDPDTSARRMGHTTEIMLSHYVLGADDRTIAAAETIEARLADQGFPVGAMLELPE
jgi:integrase